MNMPGFTAESSLGPALDHYGGATMSGTSGGGVMPTQFIIRPFEVFRCCQFIGGRFRCVSRQRLPWESCRCIRTLTGPFITCESLIFQADI